MNILPIGYPLGFSTSTGEYLIERIGCESIELTSDEFVLWYSAFLDEFRLNDSNSQSCDALVEKGLFLSYENSIDLFEKIVPLNITRSGFGWQNGGQVCVVLDGKAFVLDAIQHTIWQKSNGMRTVGAVFKEESSANIRVEDGFKDGFTNSIIILVKNALVRLR